jgi:hypothetical protein
MSTRILNARASVAALEQTELTAAIQPPTRPAADGVLGDAYSMAVNNPKLNL